MSFKILHIISPKLKHIFSKNGLYWAVYYFLLATRTGRLLSDELFLKLQYRCACGQGLNLKNPQSFNEKLQWLKIRDHNPLYTTLVDKASAKEYVKKILGDDHIIPTIAIYNCVDDIEWNRLPKQFVIKCTHDSGGNIICRDKQKLNIEAAKQKLADCMKKNFYWNSREWPYKDIKPRIIVEQYMSNYDSQGKPTELTDYKFFCFNGIPKALFIATDRYNPNEETKFDFFDMDFNHFPFRGGHPNSAKPILKPDGFDEMKKIAMQLSKSFPHVRIDLYNINGHIYFGEFTFYHWGGMMPFIPNKWNYIFGSWLEIGNN